MFYCVHGNENIRGSLLCDVRRGPCLTLQKNGIIGDQYSKILEVVLHSSAH